MTQNVTRQPRCDEVVKYAATEDEDRLERGQCGRFVASAVGCHTEQGRQPHLYVPRGELSYEK